MHWTPKGHGPPGTLQPPPRARPLAKYLHSCIAPWSQRLAGSGYCFSASNPPYLVATGIKSLEIMKNHPERVQAVRRNAQYLRNRLASVPGVVLSGSDGIPIIHMRLDEEHASARRIDTERTLQRIVDSARQRGVALTRAKYVHTTKFLPPPSIRISVSCDHTEQQLQEAVDVIQAVVAKELGIASD